MKGKRIAILEARLGEQLAELVAARGGVPVRAPALAEVPDLDGGAIAELVRSLEGRPAALAIFQTGVGTRALFNATDGLGLTPKFLALLAKSIVVARGPKPTAALRSRGVRIDRPAAEPYTTHEVLAAIGARRGGGGDPHLSLVTARGYEAPRGPDRRARAARDRCGGVHQRRAGAQPLFGLPGNEKKAGVARKTLRDARRVARAG